MNYATIHNQIIHHKLIVVRDYDLDLIKKALKKEKLSTKFLDEESVEDRLNDKGIVATVFHNEGCPRVVVLRKTDINTIAHESLHIASFIIRDYFSSNTIHDTNEELWAYLVGFYAEELHNAVKKLKK